MSDEPVWNDAIVETARRFHDIYEEEAARFGWQSQTPVPFDELPEANKQTMLNTIARATNWAADATIARLAAGRDRALAERNDERAKRGDLYRRYSALKAKMTATTAELATLKARVEATIEIHEGFDIGAKMICSDCEKSWPCPTLRALTGDET